MADSLKSRSGPSGGIVSNLNIKIKMFTVLGLDVGIKNLAICHLDSDGEVVRWHLADCSTDKKSTISDAIRNVVGYLRTLQLPNTVVIAIEQQPCGRGRVSNTTMRCVQASIEAWALCSQYHYLNFSPARKLGKNAPKQYAERKKLAVCKVTDCLKEPWQSFFLKHKKQDDLADAYLIAKQTILDIEEDRKKTKK